MGFYQKGGGISDGRKKPSIWGLKMALNGLKIAKEHFNFFAIASCTTYPCQSVGEWVGQSAIDSFRLEIAVASPSFSHKYYLYSL